MSRSLVLLLASSILATGCVAHGKNRGAANVVNGVLVVGGGALAIGAGYELSSMEEPENGFEGLGQVISIPYLAAVTVIGLGLVAAGGAGLVQSHAYDDEPPAPIAVAPAVTPQPEVASSSSYAVHLTAQARTLAAVGRCGAVRLLDDDVAAADPAYHRDVFRADPVLAPCL